MHLIVVLVLFYNIFFLFELFFFLVFFNDIYIYIKKDRFLDLIKMNEEIEILKSIYCRPNEIIYDDLLQRIIYNAFDDNLQTIAFSVNVYINNMIIIESQILTKDELKQLQTNACLTTTLYDLFIELKSFYDELMIKRTKKIEKFEEFSSSFLMKIDHMRSPNVYMKHLKQWTDELNITGRVMVIPHEIFILTEGNNEKLKV